MTGYEPRTLRSYSAPISVCAKGIAGLGLFDSNFTERNVYSGQLGEVGFYKALCLEGIIDDFSSYWSVAMPGTDGRAAADPTFETDVDCVIVQGDTIYLIDLKYYASGGVTWYSQGTWLLCRDDATGKQVKAPRRMSRNMAMAKDRFPAVFPGKRIEAYVVLAPTDDGIGTVRPGTSWPGEVPLITLPDMIGKLRSGGSAHADPRSDAALTALLKG